MSESKSSGPTAAASRRCAKATGPRSTRALADDLTYVHSTARLSRKKEHMDISAPASRTIAVSRRVPTGAGARRHRVVNGVSEMHVENAGKEQRFTIRYSRSTRTRATTGG